MYRGSTPVHRFRVNLDLRDATVFVTYAQGDKIVLEKTGADLTITETEVICSLTQEDTLAFDADDTVSIQLRYVRPDGCADASAILQCSVHRILKEGVIACSA